MCYLRLELHFMELNELGGRLKQDVGVERFDGFNGVFPYR